MNLISIIKDYYERGLWDKKRVYNVVGKALDEKDYLEIVGEEYK